MGENMFILTANRLLVLAILVSVPFRTMETVALANGDAPQSGGSTAKHMQVAWSSGLELLTDTEGIDFNPYLFTVLISVRQNWYSIMPPSVKSGEQGINTAELRVLQNGKVPVDFLKLTVPSGNEEFDRASLIAIRASAPFSNLPEKFSQPFIVLRITFYYNMPRKSSVEGRTSVKSASTLVERRSRFVMLMNVPGKIRWRSSEY